MSKISAGLTNTTAILVTGDTTGNLVIETAGNVVAATFDSNQNVNFANSVTVTGTINANISGNGASLTNINASNISSGTIGNAFTTAASANGASTIVLRDADGSFAGNVITATTSNATTFNGTTGAFTNVSGNGIALTAINASNISSGTLDNARTSAASANGASTIVARDSDGSFAGNVITGTSGSFTSVSGNGVALTAINASNITSGTIDNARTTANSSNVGATIVLRGASGEFDAGAINAASFTGNGAAISGINASNVSSGTIDNARTTAASSNGASTIVARDSNGSFTANVGTFTTLSGNLTGNVTLTTGTISTTANSATDIVNKAYVDNAVAAGTHFHEPVRVESPIDLNATYDNGTAGVGATLTNAGTQAALVIDGITMVVADRVLVYEQTDQTENGVYVVTSIGSGATNWVLTRSDDTNTYVTDSPDGLSEGSTFFVQEGTTGAGETYTCNTVGTITFGTTNITFAQVSSAQIYSAGTGLTLTGTEFSLSNTAVSAAQYGNDGAVSQITVNAQGQITAASNVSINASSISVGTLANGRTTAASANGASTIVARDSDGSFSANVVTAGTGSFTAVSGNGIALTALNASNIASGTLDNARTSAATANGASTIVLRDASGAFSAGAITGSSLSGNGIAITAINASNIASGTLDTGRISGSYTGITGVGTLTAGTWNANAVGAQYGGTGSANLTADNVILGNGANTVKVVAPGTANNVLTSNGTTWISQAAGGGGGGIPSGTVMIFGQTSAPTGFTKLTDQDNAGLRVVSGTASTGGSVNFTTAFASQTPTGSVSITAVSGSAGATTLSTPQIPSHTHTLPSFVTPYGFTGRPYIAGAYVINQQSTGATGGGGSHTHPFSFSSGSGTFSGNAINLAVKYVDVIRATKD
jgi:hypothetical protein